VRAQLRDAHCAEPCDTPSYIRARRTRVNHQYSGLCARVHSPRVSCPSINSSPANTNSRLTTMPTREWLVHETCRLQPRRVRLTPPTRREPPGRLRCDAQDPGAVRGFGFLGQFMGIRSRWRDQHRSARSLQCSHVRSRQHLSSAFMRRVLGHIGNDRCDGAAGSSVSDACMRAPILPRNSRTPTSERRCTLRPRSVEP
jgi:hypothetical protein